LFAQLTGSFNQASGGSIKKNPAQICGYPLPRRSSSAAAGTAAASSPAGGVPAGCEGLCVVPWQRCDKHLNWENHKRQELNKEQYVLERHVETLKEQEEIIRTPPLLLLLLLLPPPLLPLLLLAATMSRCSRSLV
jgi:hypothetical protein